MSEYLPLGVFTRPVGLDGAVRLTTYGDALVAIPLPDDNFFLARPALVGEEEPLEWTGTGNPAGVRDWQGACLTAVSATKKPNVYKVRIEGAGRREDAEKLRGRVLYYPLEKLPAPAEDEVYLFQLLDLAVESPDGGSRARVVQVYDYGAHACLELETEEGILFSVPWHRRFVASLDLAVGKLVYEGLADFLELAGEEATED